MYSGGCWTWFNEPKAVYSSTYNSTYMGWVDASGNIWAGKYHHGYATKDQFLLHAALEADDHDDPAIILLDDGTVFAGYSKHGGNQYCRRSSNAGDIRTWGSEVAVATSASHSYCHAMQFGDTSKTLYWFLRDYDGSNYGSLSYRASTDRGATWGSTTAIFKFATSGSRPYFRAFKTSSSRVDFALNQNHPNDGSYNLYHFYMTVASDGTRAFFKSDGTSIGGDGALPLSTSDLTQVYDGTSSKSWIWDIANDSNGLRVVFATFPSSTAHEYWRGTWSGSAWSTEKICDGGTTATADYLFSGELQYSGGICLDPNDSESVYLSREYGSGDFRLEKWTKSGGSWAKASDISGSTSSVNGRPRATLGRSPTNLWYWRGTYTNWFAGFTTNVYFDPAVTMPTAKASSAAWQGTSYGPVTAKAYYLLNEGSGTTCADLVSAVNGSFTGSPTWHSGSPGAYIDNWSTSNYVKMDSLGSSFAGASYPKWSCVMFKNTDSTNYGFLYSFGRSSDTTPIHAIAVNFNSTSNALSGFIRSDGGTESLPGWTNSANSDGNLHVAMLVSLTSSDHYLVVDGVVRANVAGTQSTTTFNQCTLGCLRRTSAALPAATSTKIYGFLVGWGSVPDYVALYNDLYTGQFSGTFAAASFQAAWARNRNQVIGIAGAT